jgi:IS1 family transposase
MTEWRLVGPDLAALIVYLSMDMRVTRRKVKQFLWDVLGLQLSTGTLQNCIVESARALEPVEAQLVEDLCRESLMHADETSHNEAGKRLWLWVFITSSTALFFIGCRTKEIFVNLFDALTDFDGHLMTDGYSLYRAYLKRLRCWAHLLRKAKGLSESYTKTSQTHGKQVLDILNSLIDAVYQAREGPDRGTVSISAHHQEALKSLRKVCEAMAASSHKKTRELGVEFLNDWEAIFRVLEYPAWPLTNNEAERALRHWVIMRKITQGTYSEQGSRALALFASVFATCRLRNSSPLWYIRDAINMRRQGHELPKLQHIPVC